MLVVPASEADLEIAVPLDPAVKLETSAGWQLVEIDDLSAVASVQLVPGLTSDGLACEEAKRLIAVVPPRQGAGDSRRFTLQPAPDEPAGAGGVAFAAVPSGSPSGETTYSTRSSVIFGPPFSLDRISSTRPSVAGPNTKSTESIFRNLFRIKGSS